VEEGREDAGRAEGEVVGDVVVEGLIEGGAVRVPPEND
jgi:hypothetical protein